MMKLAHGSYIGALVRFYSKMHRKKTDSCGLSGLHDNTDVLVYLCHSLISVAECKAMAMDHGIVAVDITFHEGASWEECPIW